MRPAIEKITALHMIADDAWAELVGEEQELTPADRAAGATPRVTCRGAGCSGCCHQRVLARTDEVALLAGVLGDAAWERVRAYQGGEREACPVLDPATGLCSAYTQRPIMCRVYGVVTPPERCSAPAGALVASPSSDLVELLRGMVAQELPWGADLEPVYLAAALRGHPMAPWNRASDTTPAGGPNRGE